ncbi:MAG: Flp pilus assembly complex ATPase component TadA [Verrucomicrobiales bacterium]|nr:Flp pilus assembly complex ATPase component TadA [Verrucomicrobiales bacterium]
MDSDAPAFLVELIHQAQASGASDIHLHQVGNRAEISFRVDGVLVPRGGLEGELAERVFGRIKYLSRLKTYQHSLPQDGRISRESVGADQDLRVATYPTVTGEKIVLRLFQPHQAAGTLDTLEFPEEVRRELENVLRSPGGLVLLTGPAGSGKTTTIYACLRFLISLGGRQIITIEDPVEQIIPGLMQTEIQEALGLDFAKATRHLLRQDPQVLVVGEIRDEETARLVVRAAMTGHLVISTLHAGSCRGVLERLLVMCPDHHAVVSALLLVLNQRLLRRTCAGCAGQGCPSCLQTGYRGRVPAVEWFRFPADASARRGAFGPESVQPATTLRQSAELLVGSGQTSRAEVERTFGP